MGSMDKSRIGWVILHYQALNETLECVESIKKICDENDIIIIVDNGSPNATGKLLYEKFLGQEGIKVILSSENLGFAKGNNIGFYEAKNEYKCDFIVLLNNDTIIIQHDFRNRIFLEYEQYRFSVMGPKILQVNGTVNTSSPSNPIHTSIFRARVGQISNYVRYILSILGLDIIFGQLVDKGAEGYKSVDIIQEDVQLSGCCWIFSKEYISRFDGINPDTFMYLEEILLYLRIKKAGLKIIYNPKLEIIHLEDAATLETFKGKTAKARRFKYRCQMQSFKVLINELKGKD